MQERSNIITNLFTGIGSALLTLIELIGVIPVTVVGVLQNMLSSQLLDITLDLIVDVLALPVRLFFDPTGAFLAIFTDLTNLGNQLVATVSGRLSCTGCYALIGLFKLLLELGMSVADCGQVLISVCITLQLMPEGECRGYIGNYQYMLFYSINASNNTLDQICGFLVPYDCGTLKPLLWGNQVCNANTTPIARQPPPPPSGSKYTFVTIADPHIDIYYEAGSNADCGWYLCCRASSPKGSNASASGAGQWGDMRLCEETVAEFQNMLNDIKTRNPDGIFWIGDNPPHDTWNQTGVPENIHFGTTLLQLTKQTMPTVPIFFCMGNHDAWPSNNFLPRTLTEPSQTNATNSADYLYTAYWNMWQTYGAPPDAQQSVMKSGSYSQLFAPGFRIISVNNNYCYFANFWILANPVDPEGVLQWLCDELQKAEDNKEKVFILIHIPPCYEDCTKEWSETYTKIIVRYANTVIGSASGHTHWDHMCITRDAGNNAVNVNYICPSATPYTDLNIGYRLFYFDKSSFQLLNHENYWMDLNAANAPGGTPVWLKLYDAKSAYNLPDLEPPSWLNWVNGMINGSDKTSLAKYEQYYSRNSPLWPACDPQCEKDLLCHIIMCPGRTPQACSNITGYYL